MEEEKEKKNPDEEKFEPRERKKKKKRIWRREAEAITHIGNLKISVASVG